VQVIRSPAGPIKSNPDPASQEQYYILYIGLIQQAKSSCSSLMKGDRASTSTSTGSFSAPVSSALSLTNKPDATFGAGCEQSRSVVCRRLTLVMLHGICGMAIPSGKYVGGCSSSSQLAAVRSVRWCITHVLCSAS
jgi:hypothetical protein